MSKHWEDRIFDRSFEVVAWPLLSAKGQAWPFRLLALTVGWLWMIPIFLVFVLIMIFTLLPAMVWRDLSQPKSKGLR